MPRWLPLSLNVAAAAAAAAAVAVAVAVQEIWNVYLGQIVLAGGECRQQEIVQSRAVEGYTSRTLLKP